MGERWKIVCCQNLSIPVIMLPIWFYYFLCVLQILWMEIWSLQWGFSIACIPNIRPKEHEEQSQDLGPICIAFFPPLFFKVLVWLFSFQLCLPLFVCTNLCLIPAMLHCIPSTYSCDVSHTPPELRVCVSRARVLSNSVAGALAPTLSLVLSEFP